MTKTHAFSLVEMLVVMAVIVTIIGLAAPAFNSIKGSGDVSKSVYDIAGILEQARAHAMLNNTYVYVGFHEADSTTPETGKQKDGGTGRISMVVIASREGAGSFDRTTVRQDFNVIGGLRHFEKMHLVNLGEPPADGGMARPSLKNNIDPKFAQYYNVGDPGCVSATPFDYPLGAKTTDQQYTFTRVIQYDPQGVARIQLTTGDSTIVKQMEIGLQPAQGNTTPLLTEPVATGNIAAIQIDGMTGAARVYRP